MRRHPDVSERHAESINTARAAVTEKNIRQWFNELHQHLQQGNNLEILNGPKRIYNADESGFETCPKTGKVLGPISFDNLYEVKSGNEKEAITVMANFNAAGDTVPPMVVFSLQKISRDISENLNSEWGIGQSKKGWMIGALYFEYIANIFLPWLKKERVKFPVLLLVDGHKSHTSYKVAKFCADNGIIQFALYPNATHVLQPADVAIFCPLKSGWRDAVYNWKHKTGNKVVTKTVFGPLLETVFNEKATPETVKNGFRKCGLFPYDPDAVDYARCMSSKSRCCAPFTTDGNAVKPSSFGVEHLLHFESLMKRGRAEEFCAAEKNEWEGDPGAEELFQVWRKIRATCISHSTNKTTDPNMPPLHLGSTEKSIPILESAAGDPQVFTNSKISCDTEDESSTCHNEKSGDQDTIQENTSSEPEPSSHPVNTEADTPKYCSSQSSQKNRISPHFANHITGPTETPIKAGRKREYIPYARTSKQWLDWNKSKEDLKANTEAVKRARIEKRKMAKQTNEKRRQVRELFPEAEKKKPPKKKPVRKDNSESESSSDEWNPSEDTSENDSDSNKSLATTEKRRDIGRPAFKEGDFALILFPGQKNNNKYTFICTIQRVTTEEDTEVMGLKCCDERNTLFKTDEDDVSTVRSTQILAILPEPSIISTGGRLRYKFQSPVVIGKLK